MISCSYEESLSLAEETCFAYLREKLGLDPSAAFIGVNPGRADCMVFDIGQSGTADLNAFRAPCAHFRAQMDLYSRDRALLQRLLMRTRRFAPVDERSDPDGLTGRGNVLQFRLAVEAGNPSAIRTVDLDIGTDQKRLTAWTATVTFDVVFLTETP